SRPLSASCASLRNCGPLIIRRASSAPTDNAVVTLSATPPKQVASRAKLILASFDPLHPSAQIAFSEFLSLIDRAGHHDRLVEAIFVFNDQHRQPEFGIWAHGNRDLVPGHGRYLELWHQFGPLARQFITPKPRKIKQNPMPERRKPPARQMSADVLLGHLEQDYCREAGPS